MFSSGTGSEGVGGEAGPTMAVEVTSDQAMNECRLLGTIVVGVQQRSLSGFQCLERQGSSVVLYLAHWMTDTFDNIDATHPRTPRHPFQSTFNHREYHGAIAIEGYLESRHPPATSALFPSSLLSPLSALHVIRRRSLCYAKAPGL